MLNRGGERERERGGGERKRGIKRGVEFSHTGISIPVDDDYGHVVRRYNHDKMQEFRRNLPRGRGEILFRAPSPWSKFSAKIRD